MTVQPLGFEKNIKDLEEKIAELRSIGQGSQVDLDEEIKKLQKKLKRLLRDTYSKLTPWQRVQVARHPMRPYTMDYIREMTTDFIELRGDRRYADDKAIVAGLAKFEGMTVAVIGHQKGRSTKENIERNFGMPHPEGYRKALRVMKLAEKFGFPVLTFIDTPGAYP
ncbi:MAG: acetyl-CoA carboxylase carboxyl transferase subunit alpha, partial [Aquificota bacterium]